MGRIAPLIALSAHVAVADVAAGWLMSDDRRRTVAASIGIALIGVIGLLGSTSGLIRMVPRAVLPAFLADDDRLTPMIAPYVSLGEILASTDVAFTSSRMGVVVPAVGGRIVVPADLMPLLSDRLCREQAGLGFFSADCA